MTAGFKFHHSRIGLKKALRDWQEITLEYIWSQDDGVNSSNVWMHVNQRLDRKNVITRASILEFLDEMVEEEILSNREKVGESDQYWYFTPKLH